jgi:hypothetical protein
MLRTISLSIVFISLSVNSRLNAQFLINPTSQDDRVLKVRIDNAVDSKSHFEYLSEIAVGVEYIPLETTSQSLLGNFLKIKIISTGILINDSQKRLHMFDFNGKHKWKIDNQGRGPGEYQSLTNFFDVNENLQEIYVPTSTKTIMVYDYKGNLKRSINAPVNVSDVTTLSTGNLLIGQMTLAINGTAYRLIDLKGNLLNNLDRNSVDVEAGTPILGPRKYKDGVVFTLRDTVWYSIDGHKLIPLIEIDRRIRGNSKSKYVSMLTGYSNSTLGITIVDPTMFVTYDYKANKFVKIGKITGSLIDDFDSYQEISIIPNYDGYAYKVIKPQDLTRMTGIKPNSKLDSIAKIIKPDDNPVLMIVKLKDKF